MLANYRCRFQCPHERAHQNYISSSPDEHFKWHTHTQRDLDPSTCHSVIILVATVKSMQNVITWSKQRCDSARPLPLLDTWIYICEIDWISECINPLMIVLISWITQHVGYSLPRKESEIGAVNRIKHLKHKLRFRSLSLWPFPACIPKSPRKDQSKEQTFGSQ